MPDFATFLTKEQGAELEKILPNDCSIREVIRETLDNPYNGGYVFRAVPIEKENK